METKSKTLAMEMLILAARSSRISHGILFSYNVFAERITYTLLNSYHSFVIFRYEKSV